MYKWQNASYIIHGDTSCSHWPAVEDKCDISPDQDFISANSAATYLLHILLSNLQVLPL